MLKRLHSRVTSFRGYAALDWGAMTAASIIAIIPMLLFAVVAQKHIVKGITLWRRERINQRCLFKKKNISFPNHLWA